MSSKSRYVLGKPNWLGNLPTILCIVQVLLIIAFAKDGISGEALEKYIWIFLWVTPLIGIAVGLLGYGKWTTVIPAITGCVGWFCVTIDLFVLSGFFFKIAAITFGIGTICSIYSLAKETWKDRKIICGLALLINLLPFICLLIVFIGPYL